MNNRGYRLTLQERQQGLEFLRLVDRRMVQDDGQRSSDALQKKTQEAGKKSGCCGLPETGREQYPGRDQGAENIEVLSALGRNEMNGSGFGPCASIGLRLRRPSLVYLSQGDLAKL